MNKEEKISLTKEALSIEFEQELFELFKKKITNQEGSGFEFKNENGMFTATRTSELQLQNSILEKSVEDFFTWAEKEGFLSTRAISCLRAGKLHEANISELLTYQSNDLLKFRNFGNGSLKELLIALFKFGIKDVFDYPIGKPGYEFGAQKIYSLQKDLLEIK